MQRRTPLQQGSHIGPDICHLCRTTGMPIILESSRILTLVKLESLSKIYRGLRT
jgi:hypothetical protein